MPAKIRQRPGEAACDLQARRMHRSGLAARLKSRPQGRKQAVAKMAAGGLKCGDHGCGDASVGKQVPTRCAVATLRLGPDPKRHGARVDRRAAFGVDNHKLPVVEIGAVPAHLGQGAWRVGTPPEGVKDQRAKFGVGHVLAGHGADAGADMGAARRHRR